MESDEQFGCHATGKQFANLVTRSTNVKKLQPDSVSSARFSVVNPSKAFYPNSQISLTLWICLLIVLPCVSTYALDRDRSIVQFHHTAWGVNEGAPTEISALAQTEDGYLWIGSPQCLFCFDGVNFEVNKPQPGGELTIHGTFYLTATPDWRLWS